LIIFVGKTQKGRNRGGYHASIAASTTTMAVTAANKNLIALRE
jgi:hypothetical protein